jgi:mannose-6-phosphate isomerase-like protein (cupin superfamily)
MWKAILGALAVLFALSAADTKPTSATYVTNGDVQATLRRAPENSVADQQIRVVDLGKYNVGVGVVHRSAKATQSAVEHDQVTEIYHIIEGSGTLVTGGTLVNPRRRPPDAPQVRELNGPSAGGTTLRNGESRRVVPGDVIIIPAGVGHWFSAIDGSIRYLVVRIDSDKVLPSK